MVRRLCTICARGGSKGVPNKNIRKIRGKPLIVHSIEHARASNLFERVAVSTDSEEIIAVARAAGVDDIIERPPEMATDAAPKVPAILHALTTIEARHSVRYDTNVDLDVTAPQRLPEDIRGAVALLEQSGVASVVTGCRSYRSPYFDLLELQSGGSVVVAKVPEREFTRRQDVPVSFDMNASIYVWRSEIFRRDAKVFYPDTRLFEMPPERSREIDSELDFKIVETVMMGAGMPSAFDLTGKVALISGGGGNLGPQFAKGLAQSGASVALLDVDSHAIDGTAESISQAYGTRVLALTCDITKPDQVAKAVARVEAELGPIDILHNNAATKGPDIKKFFDPLEAYELATWQKIMAVNVDAAFLVTREVGARMTKRERGSIILTASIYGVIAPDARIYEGSEYLGQRINTPLVYSTSKAAILGMTRHLAAQWAPFNVRVNAITPGGVRSGQNSEFVNKYSARVPLGRMAEPHELNGALVFLASDASSYVTGQNIIVDGGLSVW